MMPSCHWSGILRPHHPPASSKIGPRIPLAATGLRFPFLLVILLSSLLVKGQTPAPAGAPPGAAPPIPAPAVSPMDRFRELLAMTPAKRTEALAVKPEHQRLVLLRKIQEYEEMPLEEREERLKATQLLHDLLRLLSLPPAKRSERLNLIPEKERKVIEERLTHWDLLPPAAQQEILENELTLQQFLRAESQTPPPINAISSLQPTEYRRVLEDRLEQWRSFPQEKRQRMSQRFEEFFQLPAREREKTLNVFTEEERQKMEESLQVFARLSPEQRAMCIDSFRKLASLSREERDQFLKNAARWETMSSRERQSWRNLMGLMAPATPPILLPRGHPAYLRGKASPILRSSRSCPAIFDRIVSLARTKPPSCRNGAEPQRNEKSGSRSLPPSLI